MNPEDKVRFAAGETDEPPSAPDPSALSEQESVRKDTSYGPASETETQQKQADPLLNHLDGDIDMDAARMVPGTGGPYDTGDDDVHPEEVQLL